MQSRAGNEMDGVGQEVRGFTVYTSDNPFPCSVHFLYRPAFGADGLLSAPNVSSCGAPASPGNPTEEFHSQLFIFVVR